MSSPTTYADTLRTIGQAIDLWRLEDFDLENYDNSFFVRGRVGSPRQKLSLLQALLGKAHGEDAKFLEFRYTSADVARLEEEGQAQRRDPNGMPDFYNLSQLLRTVGAYVDGKPKRLRKLCRRGTRLTLEFETPQGQPDIEEHTISSFYNLFVHRYLRRSGHSATT